MTTSIPEGTLLKKDRIGRIMYPKGRREALLAEFERSGMSGKAFADWAGINYGTLMTWLCHRRRVEARKEALSPSALESKVHWVEAVEASGPTESQPIQLPPPEHGRKTMVVQGPRGVRLELNEERHVLWAVKLLRHLEEGC